MKISATLVKLCLGSRRSQSGDPLPFRRALACFLDSTGVKGVRVVCTCTGPGGQELSCSLLVLVPEVLAGVLPIVKALLLRFAALPRVFLNQSVGGVAHGVLLLLWLTTFVVAVSSLATAETGGDQLLVVDLCRR